MIFALQVPILLLLTLIQQGLGYVLGEPERLEESPPQPPPPP